jgi:aldose 1-epimerase
MSHEVKPGAAFETVSLHDPDASLQATFVPGAGMLCCSLLHHGDELLAQNAGIETYAQSGKTMGIPLLYPWANRLSGFDYSVTGRTVSVPHDPTCIALDQNGLPIHGVIGGRMAWEIVRASRADAPSLLARLIWSEERAECFEVFPFHHDVHYEARLASGRLEIEIVVRACGEDTVPVGFGFHPYLSLPGVARERWLVELPAMRHLALDNRQIPVGAGQASSARRFELAGNEFDDGFDSVDEPARFSVSAEQRHIELEFSKGYPCAQVYAPQSGQFICFEPMTAPTNALRSGAGLRLLAPSEEHRATFALTVIQAASQLRNSSDTGDV